jgi:hypothetical protein
LAQVIVYGGINLRKHLFPEALAAKMVQGNASQVSVDTTNRSNLGLALESKQLGE